MSSKSKTATSAKFYKDPAKAEELHTGFLKKSPAPPAVGTLTQKSWKTRYFVLSKTAKDDYQLTYYRNEDSQDKPLGKIDLLKISLLFTGPEAHPTWDYIQKHFKCAPSMVLFLRVETRDYFLIGKNSIEVDDWFNAIVTVLKKSQTKLQLMDDNLQKSRIRSISAPLGSFDIQDEEQEDEKYPAPAAMSTLKAQSHYDYPRKLSEPPVPAERKVSVVKMDENDGKKEEPPEESSEYMLMSSVQMALDDEEQGTTSVQSYPLSHGLNPSVCNGVHNKEEDDENKGITPEEKRKSSLPSHLNFSFDKQEKRTSNPRDTDTHLEKDICISPKSLKSSLTLTQEKGKPCVSECRQGKDSSLFQIGDQILALNDLLIDSVEEIETYLRRLSKDEVKLTIRRLSGFQPLHCDA